MKCRSLLFVPASEDRFFAKAHTRGADAIILDLEDSVVAAEEDAQAAFSFEGDMVDAPVLARARRILDI